MKFRSSNRSTLWMAAVFAAACMASFANGATGPAPGGEVLKQVVRYGDLNLERSEGIAVLYRRIASAARQVCWPLQSREPSQMSAWRPCVNSSISRAVTKINVASLTAYANARNGRPSSTLAAVTK
jgi:UrcA family protein